jgi:hypothetical protein
MRNLFVFCLLTTVITACGQHKHGITTHSEVLNSKYVRMVKDTTVMMLIENVEVAYGDLYAKADSVLLDKTQKTVWVYGARNATFKAEAISGKGNIIKYTKGDAGYSIE